MMNIIKSRLGWVLVTVFIGLIAMSWGSMYYCARIVKGEGALGCAFIPNIPAQPTSLFLEEIAVAWTDQLVPYKDSYGYLSSEFIAYRNRWDEVRRRFERNFLLIAYVINGLAIYFIGFGIEKVRNRKKAK